MGRAKFLILSLNKMQYAEFCMFSTLVCDMINQSINQNTFL